MKRENGALEVPGTREGVGQGSRAGDGGWVCGSNAEQSKRLHGKALVKDETEGHVPHVSSHPWHIPGH